MQSSSIKPQRFVPQVACNGIEVKMEGSDGQDCADGVTMATTTAGTPPDNVNVQLHFKESEVHSHLMMVDKTRQNIPGETEVYYYKINMKGFWNNTNTQFIWKLHCQYDECLLLIKERQVNPDVQDDTMLCVCFQKDVGIVAMAWDGEFNPGVNIFQCKPVENVFILKWLCENESQDTFVGCEANGEAIIVGGPPDNGRDWSNFIPINTHINISFTTGTHSPVSHIENVWEKRGNEKDNENEEDSAYGSSDFFTKITEFETVL